MYRFSLIAGFLLFIIGTATANEMVDDSVRIIVDSDSLIVCEGTSIELAATDAEIFSWSPAADFDNPGAQVVQLTPSQSQWYFLTAFVSGVQCRDSVYVTVVDPVFNVEVDVTDTICPETPLDVVFQSNAPISEISWMPDDGVEDPANTNGTIIRPGETTEYIVTATIGNCEVSDTFEINVVPFSLEVLTGDTLFLCKPDQGTIVLSVDPEVDITWSPLDEFIEPMGEQAFVTNTVSSTYTATAMYMGCTLARDIVVRVDSLPALDLAIIPEKDPYCAGDEIFIIGVNVDTTLYPDLEFLWIPDDGQIQDSTNTGNVHIVTRDTTRFVRYVTNNACRDSSEATINVIPPGIPLSVTDTTLCPGEMFTVEVLDQTIEEIMWMPPDGLSCTECFNPKVTVQPQPITYMVSGMKEDCPVGASLNVTPKPDYLIPVVPNPVAGCPGDEIQLNIDTTGIANLNISFQAGSGQLSCTSCPDPILTIQENATLLITGTQTDPNFCDAIAAVPVTIFGPQSVNGGVVVACPGEPVLVDLSDLGLVNPMITIDGEATVSCTNCLMPEVTLTGSGAANMIVDSEESGPDYCGRQTTFTITPAAQDGAAFEVSDSMPGQGEIVTVTLLTQPPAPAGTQYSWTVNGNPIPDDGASAEVPLDLAGENIVTVTWINSSGCLQMASITIFALEPVINIPNAFTPNNDDYNDNFRINIVGNIQLTEFLIFNRWGQVVYDNTDPEGWDGTFNGEPAPPEVYVYLAKFRFPSGKTESRKGDVTLIR